MITKKQRGLLRAAPNGVTNINTVHFNPDFQIRESLINLAYSIVEDAYVYKDSSILTAKFIKELNILRLSHLQGGKYEF